MNRVIGLERAFRRKSNLLKRFVDQDLILQEVLVLKVEKIALVGLTIVDFDIVRGLA